MTADLLNDKLSIKTLLFTKALPNYIIPLPTDGHKLFSCTDCGDRYIMESSYDYHVNRKSVKITYKCRHCGESKVFYNRCNLLSHIRSHAFKTATINVSDLKVEPLPIDFFTLEPSNGLTTQITNKSQKSTSSICYECKMDNTKTGIAYKDRARHYMQYTNEVYSCPICMFTLPTTCALKAHLRLHLKNPPFYCPECGIHLSNKSIHYPFGHDCEGFKMMRATARLTCSIDDLHIFHPNEYNQHMKSYHLKKVYKCPVCIVACFNEESIQTHLKYHTYDVKPVVFYQCEKCSGKLVLKNQVDNHLKTHTTSYAFPCWTCGTIFKETTALIRHHMNKHSLEMNISKQFFTSILNDKSYICRVVKRCEKCKYNFTFKCKHNEIEYLPDKCPNKCTTKLNPQEKKVNVVRQIICHICKNKISQNWEEIKKHYAKYHKSHKCVDVKVVLKKLNIKEYEKKKKDKNTLKNKTSKRIQIRERQNKDMAPLNNTISESTHSKTQSSEFICYKCGEQNEDKKSLETHMISHRDPYMAYQCMECGQSFVVKPSFSKHLLLEHGISDVLDYINKKQCFNENALIKYLNKSEDNEPLKENQCQICREQFNDSDSLQKHFRVHGMAFLMKNTNKNNSP
ncbi:unnamed protein product [Parnassius mnemosyne]|uniref:C2H2-type domain-containing protein n=1 Tax=Parnassius mnemosyne TaxID=213953 RepID=A0AAV1M4K5_9NEOP